MRDFIRFMSGHYWSDPDSNAVGGKMTLIFCWVFLTIACGSCLLILLKMMALFF